MTYALLSQMIEGLRSALTGNVELRDTVGERVTPSFLPQEQPLPAVVFTMTSAQRDRDFGGDQVVDTADLGLARVSIQFEVYGRSHAEALEVCDAVDAAIRTAEPDWGGVSPQEIERQSVNDLSDIDGDRAVWLFVSDYTVHYHELNLER